VGQTTHLAARMEQLARPGTTFITDATRRLADYGVADAAATVTWRSLELRCMVRNVLDRRYENFGTYAENPTRPGNPVERWLTPGLPRHLTVSLSTDF